MRRLTKLDATGFTAALLTLAALILSLFIKNTILIALPFILIGTAVIRALLRKRSIHSYNKNQVLLIVIVFAVLFLSLYYLSGLEFGLVVSNKGRITLPSFVKNVLPITLTIIACEIIRETLTAQKMRMAIPLSYAIGIAAELVCAGGVPDFHTSYQVADFFGLTLLPAFTANILYTYLSKRYGMFPNIAYRLIMTLYVYFIPATSDIPRAVHAFFLLILPIIIRAFIAALFEKKRRFALKKEGKLGIVAFGISVLLMLSFILLITCQFRFGMVVIATDSMTGQINRGDAVVYEQYEHCEDIEVNDVIIFEENNRRVVHRVVAINTVNGQRQYITKGDANEGIDSGFRTERDIIGKIRFKVLYIGYPSLWLRKIISN